MQVHMHRRQGHYFCPACRHGVYARSGGCRTCGMSLNGLLLLDDAISQGVLVMDDPFLFDPLGSEIVATDGFGDTTIVTTDGFGDTTVTREDAFGDEEVIEEDGFGDVEIFED